MKCPRCGASVMLGSAQCAKCSASVLDGTVPETPRPARSMVTAPAGSPTSSPAPTLPPPPPAPPDAPPPFTAPPPPPSVSTSRTESRQQRRTQQRAQRPQAQPQPGAKPSVGCGGCLGPLIAVVAIGAGVAAFAGNFVDDIQDAVDGGEEIAAPEVFAGESIEFELGSDDTGVHPFVAQRSGPFIVSVTAVGDFDPKVRVVDAAGSELGSDDDGGPDAYSSQLTVDLEVGQPCTIEVEEFSGDSGEYVLLVRSGVVEGAPIGRAASVDGRVDQDEVASHAFTGAGGPLTVRVLGRDGFDPVLTIRAGTGTVLGRNDDADGLDSRLDLDVPLDSTITIEVEGLGGRAGAYTVVVD